MGVEVVKSHRCRILVENDLVTVAWERQRAMIARGPHRDLVRHSSPQQSSSASLACRRCSDWHHEARGGGYIEPPRPVV
jgi:hypothetical protein